MQMPSFRAKPVRTETPKCRIKFKNNGDSEVIEFSQSCTKEQIQLAREMHNDRKGKFAPVEEIDN